MEHSHLCGHDKTETSNRTDDNLRSDSGFLDSGYHAPAQPPAEMNWESVAKRAIIAQDQWRKEYSTIKNARENTNRGWQSVAKSAIDAQNEWRKEYCAAKATGPKSEEPKLPTLVVKEMVQSIRARAVISDEKVGRTEEVEAVMGSKLVAKDELMEKLRADATGQVREKTKIIDELQASAAERAKEKDKVIDELRNAAAEREAVHNASMRRLEKKIRQMHRQAQSHESLVTDMQNEVSRRDKALEKSLKESQNPRGPD